MSQNPIPLRADPSATSRAHVASLMRAAAASCFESLNNVPAAEVLAQRWGDDRNAAFILRAAVSPLTLTGAPVGLSTVTQDFLAALAPASAGAELLGLGLQLNFEGQGSICLGPVLPCVAELATKMTRSGSRGR